MISQAARIQNARNAHAEWVMQRMGFDDLFRAILEALTPDVGPNTEGTAAPSDQNTGFYRDPIWEKSAPPVQRGVRTEAEEALIDNVLRYGVVLSVHVKAVRAERAALAHKEKTI